LTELLAKLTKVKFRPNQRLYLLRQHLIPTLLHELVLGRVTEGLLDTWDELIKHFLKRHLKLDHWVVDCLIHLLKRKGKFPTETVCIENLVKDCLVYDLQTTPIQQPIAEITILANL
jgi:hypothetical protein